MFFAFAGHNRMRVHPQPPNGFPGALQAELDVILGLSAGKGLTDRPQCSIQRNGVAPHHDAIEQCREIGTEQFLLRNTEDARGGGVGRKHTQGRIGKQDPLAQTVDDGTVALITDFQRLIGMTQGIERYTPQGQVQDAAR